MNLDEAHAEAKAALDVLAKAYEAYGRRYVAGSRTEHPADYGALRAAREHMVRCLAALDADPNRRLRLRGSAPSALYCMTHGLERLPGMVRYLSPESRLRGRKSDDIARAIHATTESLVLWLTLADLALDHPPAFSADSYYSSSPVVRD